MRLIDADKMLKRIESWNTSDSMDKALYNFTLNRIIEQPTVDAWKFVYEELTKLRMFTGIYDAKHGDEHFMYGVQTVMEVIAERAGCQDEFNEMFMHNVVESEERAERKEE